MARLPFLRFSHRLRRPSCPEATSLRLAATSCARVDYRRACRKSLGGKITRVLCLSSRQSPGLGLLPPRNGKDGTTIAGVCVEARGQGRYWSCKMAFEDEEEKIIDEFMGDSGRAEQWRAMRESLEDRLRALQAARAASTSTEASAALDRKIVQVAQQVAALETEEVVSQFVE